MSLDYDSMDREALLSHLKNALRDLEGVRRQVRSEHDTYERLRDMGRAAAIIRTADGLLVHLTRDEASLASRPWSGAPAVIYRQCGDKPPADFKDPLSLVRKLRKYVETAERVRGIPVFEEVEP